MPGVKNTTKPSSKKTRVAEEKSNKAIASAITNHKSSFARVEKVLGGRRFHVAFHDGDQLHTGILATPRGIFSAGGRSRVPITTGSFVLLEGAEVIKAARAKGQDVVLEIYGVLDRPTAHRLYSSGRLHTTIFNTDENALDELFMSTDEVEADLDLDIDAI